MIIDFQAKNVFFSSFESLPKKSLCYIEKLCVVDVNNQNNMKAETREIRFFGQKNEKSFCTKKKDKRMIYHVASEPIWR
jgi:hypothetical protein